MFSEIAGICKKAELQEDAQNFSKCKDIAHDVNMVTNTMMDVGNIENMGDIDITNQGELLFNGRAEYKTNDVKRNTLDLFGGRTKKIPCQLYLFRQCLMVCSIRFDFSCFSLN